MSGLTNKLLNKNLYDGNYDDKNDYIYYFDAMDFVPLFTFCLRKLRTEQIKVGPSLYSSLSHIDHHLLYKCKCDNVNWEILWKKSIFLK